MKLDVGEVALVDAEGGSNISGADFAHAIAEKIDNAASSNRMSSTESVPAAMPAIRQPTLARAFTPQSAPGGRAAYRASVRQRVFLILAAQSASLFLSPAAWAGVSP